MRPPSAISLGLDRCRRVAERLGLLAEGVPRVTVAGTNGKGSTVAFLEAMLTRSGVRVGAWTSPHVLSYNERVRIGGEPIADEALISAFEEVADAGADTSLTYFEIGTLAALCAFRRGGVDVALLEVGLGGRLDAVNVFEPRVCVITAIGIDHVAWLGPDRETIGFEKAGILRAGVPAVVSDGQPPVSVLARAAEIGAPVHRLGVDFHARAGTAHWRWWTEARSHDGLPRPVLAGEHQIANAAGAIMALYLLDRDGIPDQAAIREGLAGTVLRGRIERVRMAPRVIVDMAHNEDASRVLAAALAIEPPAARTEVVVGMLDDKDVEATIGALRGHASHWHVCRLPGARAAPAERIAADACDFARYCAGARLLLHQRSRRGADARALARAPWRASASATSALGRSRRIPDLVAFVGWEWTQAGATPEAPLRPQERDLSRDSTRTPSCPRVRSPSLPDGTMERAPRHGAGARGRGRALALRPLGSYADFLWLIGAWRRSPECEAGVDTRALPPPTAARTRPTPEVLFEKLAQWDLETLVIPHGLAWGIHAPPGATLDDAAVARARHDPERMQRCSRSISGHGNSESGLRLAGAASRPRRPGRQRPSAREPTARLSPVLLAGGGDHASALRRPARRRVRGARGARPAP